MTVRKTRADEADGLKAVDKNGEQNFERNKTKRKKKYKGAKKQLAPLRNGICIHSRV